MIKKCIICGGKLFFVQIEFHNNIIDAYKCKKCGEEFFNPRQTDIILKQKKEKVELNTHRRWIFPLFIISFILGMLNGMLVNDKLVINIYEQPCMGIYCPQKSLPFWNLSIENGCRWPKNTIWYNSSWTVDEHGFCPNNLTMREIICDCAKTESEYYEKWNAPCMAYCFRCE